MAGFGWLGWSMLQHRLTGPFCVPCLRHFVRPLYCRVLWLRPRYRARFPPAQSKSTPLGRSPISVRAQPRGSALCCYSQPLTTCRGRYDLRATLSRLSLWRAPCDGRLVHIDMATNSAPGAGQTFTYTARKNGVDTALTGSATGAGVFGAQAWSAIMRVHMREDAAFAQYVKKAMN